MKRKGFTLIELLVVIVVIAVLATIISPVIIKLLNRNKQSLYDSQKRTLEKAAERWSVDNIDKLDELENDENSSYCLSLDSLALEGYISGSDLINAVTKKDLVGSISITYDIINNQYEFTFKENKVCNPKKAIEEAAKKWSESNDDKLEGLIDGTINSYCLSLEILTSEEYIPSSILVNSETNENLAGSVSITYDSVIREYKFKFKENQECNN